MKSDRKENNNQRKPQGLASAPVLHEPANKREVSKQGGEKKKVPSGKLSHAVTAGQRK